MFNWFRKKPAPAAQQPKANCQHLVVAPRWDSVKDIGHDDKATGYRCTVCSAYLSLEEGKGKPRQEQQRP